MASQTRQTSAALTMTLLAHEGNLPRDLVETLVDRASKLSGSLALEALVDRPELTASDLERISAAVSTAQYSSDVSVGKLLARLPVRAGDDALAHLRRVRTARVGMSTLVYFVLGSRHVRDDVLDVLEEASDPQVLAAYANHTPRGADARHRALERLESHLGPDRKRVNETVANQAAHALAKLLDEDAPAAREQLLATYTRPLLLALGAPETPWEQEQTFARLDEATRAHLIRLAVLPVFTEDAATRKDRDLATTLVLRLKGHLEVDILRQMVPLLPSSLAQNLGAELASRGAAAFDPAAWTMRTLAYGSKNARPAGAEWLLDSLEDAAQVLGWTALMKLADEACGEDVSLLDLRAVLDGVAAGPPARESA